MNCVSGTGDAGHALATHPGVDGVLFIGSHRAGLNIRRALVDHPEKIVALEMGGNNPLVVWDYEDLRAAVHTVVQSSMVTAGQRCSAARRLFLRTDDDALLPAVLAALSSIRIGHYTLEPEPYYGPLIRPAAAAKVVEEFNDLANSGGRILLEPKLEGPVRSVVLPGLIEMTGSTADKDEEIFGPVLKVYRVGTLDEAIDLANNTKFGLSAGIVSADRERFELFYRRTKAGIVNWNQQLTGATMFAPFGGIKQSGNYRPAGSCPRIIVHIPRRHSKPQSPPYLRSFPQG